MLPALVKFAVGFKDWMDVSFHDRMSPMNILPRTTAVSVSEDTLVLCTTRRAVETMGKITAPLWSDDDNDEFAKVDDDDSTEADDDDDDGVFSSPSIYSWY